MGVFFGLESPLNPVRAKRTEGAARSPGRPAAWRFEELRNVSRVQ